MQALPLARLSLAEDSSMHELSIAHSVVEQAVAFARRENATAILSLTVEIGAMSGVMAQPFIFCFPDAAQATMLEGARLIVEEKPVTLFCRHCGDQVLEESFAMLCPCCHSMEVQVMSGKDIRIKNMEII